MICIDEENDGAVVYLNHDRHMQVVFMNSNVTAFATVLCLFAELMRNKDAESCRRGIQEIDPTAMTSGNFWPSEVDMLARDR